eukprot:2395288-Pyramimonas_sp.AAC.1
MHVVEGLNINRPRVKPRGSSHFRVGKHDGQIRPISARAEMHNQPQVRALRGFASLRNLIVATAGAV